MPFWVSCHAACQSAAQPITSILIIVPILNRRGTDLCFLLNNVNKRGLSKFCALSRAPSNLHFFFYVPIFYMPQTKRLNPKNKKNSISTANHNTAAPAAAVAVAVLLTTLIYSHQFFFFLSILFLDNQNKKQETKIK